MNNSDIQHSSVRAVLEYLHIENGIEIHHTGDLPSRSGLGSSSSFTVGMLHAINALNGNIPHKYWLANDAIHIEREILQENVGIQDQIAAAYGGFNKTIISPNGDFKIEPIVTPRLEELQNHLMLFFTGVSRTASDIAEEQINMQKRGDKTVELSTMRALVDEALNSLLLDDDIGVFGSFLHQSWLIKKDLTKNIAPEFVNVIYEKARNAGAIGGKLLGAGGGGFMLLFARPEDHDRVRTALKDLLWVPFKFEKEGSKIIFNQPNSYSRESLVRRDYSHGL